MTVEERVELTVVGTLMAAPTQVGYALSRLAVTDFNQLGARTLFQAIGKLFLTEKPIDPLTVLAEAGSDCEPVVDLIMDQQLITVQLTHYIDLVLEQSKLRAVRLLGESLSQAESVDAAGALCNRLCGLFLSKQGMDIVEIKDAVMGFVEAQNRTEQPDYLTWGIPQLDEKLFVDLGDLVVVGGYPSAGKTLLSLQMAVHLAETYRVGYFSLETSPAKLTDRIMAAQASIPLYKIKRQSLSTTEWDAVRDAGQLVSQRDLKLIRASGMTVTDIRAVTLQHKLQVIFVDYLQLVRANGAGRYEQVTAISMGLHTLAQDLGVAVIALAQLSRPEKSATGGKSKPPSMSSFRESGQIEQDADVAMLLYPETPNDNGGRRILKISKNKEGGSFALTMDFDGPTQRLTPAEVRADASVSSRYVAEGLAAKTRARAQVPVEFEDLDADSLDTPFEEGLND